MPELILAIDVGTTSARSAVLAPDGAILGLAGAPIASVSPRPGWVEQDAAKIWRALRRTIGKALEDAGRAAGDLACVGVTSQRASALVWDKASGAPLTPMVVWSDLRGTARAAELAHAGFLVVPQQSATKLEGLFAAAEAPAGRLAWGNIDSYVIWRLTGGAVHATDRGQAWPSGYLDLPDLGWNARLIDHQGLPASAFPTLVDTWGPMGATAKSVLGATVPVTADVADQQAALIAHGEAAGTAKITWGTAAALDLATGPDFRFLAPAVPPLLVSHAGGEVRWCVEGMMNAAGSALDWLRGVCRLGSHAQFEVLAVDAPDAGGAAFLPALQGLGAPHGDPSRRGALRGLTAAVDRAHIARAGLEGLAFRAREMLEAVQGLSDIPFPEAIGADGGLTRSRLFLQTLADLTGRPVRRHATVEATLLGAALAAGRGGGLLTETDIAAARRFEAPVTPRLGADEAAERFTAWRSAVYG
jgi:glycerol kinase